ncbi:hypothetical protein Tsubulata_034121, partial [Turnera subulata]
MQNVLNVTPPSSSKPATPQATDMIPFSKPLGFFPPDGGIPLQQQPNPAIPVTGSSAQTLDFSNIGLSFPARATLQELEFGSIKEINQDLFESTIYGSLVVGKAKGIFVASSEDGTTSMMAMTANFAGNEFKDGLKFFGAHKTDLRESHIAVIGGTGKYHNANGYAVIKAVDAGSHAAAGEANRKNEVLLFNNTRFPSTINHQLFNIFSLEREGAEKESDPKMAKTPSIATRAVKATLFLFLLAIAFSSHANSARILNEVDPQDPTLVGPPATATVPPTTAATLPSGQVPAVAAATTIAPAAPAATDEEVSDPPLPETDAPAVVPAPVADDEPQPEEEVAAPVTPPTIPAPIAAGPATTTSATVPNPAATNPQTSATTATAATSGTPLSFYMHDISGGSHPSSRVVTGIIARTEINGIPFSVPNNNFFPLQGGTPLLNINNLNNLINPNTAPLLTGLTGAQANTFLQNTGNNNNVVSQNQPFVTAGNLPAGITLQKLMFGSITVVDNELTEGHELGSGVVGRAQGFYLASSVDGTSHTVALTVLLHGGDSHGEVEDTISFFGVHRTATPDSEIAVVGGTGKYEDARGYAVVETIQEQDQHTTD